MSNSSHSEIDTGHIQTNWNSDVIIRMYCIENSDVIYNIYCNVILGVQEGEIELLYENVDMVF